MEDQDGRIMAQRLLLATCAAGFFWLFAVHVLTGLLDSMTKGGVGSRSGMVANIDDTIDSLLVFHLGGPLTAGVLFIAGIGAAWLICRTPRQDAGKKARRDSTQAISHRGRKSGLMFWKRKKRGMDPNSAHKISFALAASKDEIAGLMEIAHERGLPAVVDRLTRHGNALTKIQAGFSTRSENLQELADQTEAIGSDITEIEQLLELGENDQSFHCYLASSTLSVEAKIARGEIR